MRRQDKYPDTEVFHYYNRNPHGRVTDDCAIRAISTALDMDYNSTLREMCQLQCRTGYMINSRKGIDCYLKSKGWIKHKQPKK